MSRLLLTLCLAVCSTVVLGKTDRVVSPAESAQAHPEKRVALVIGNGAYASSRLANPVNDAKDMAAALTRCGFTVTSVTDADKRAMRQGIRTFIEGLDRGSVALFYFAGHAVQSRGENYMIPVGADVTLEDEIPDECVSLTSVLGSLENARTGINLIILDACRDNPFRGFKRSLDRGLKVLEAPKDSESLIAYATAPGSVAADGTGRNGIYTACLLKYLTTPNMPVETVFKQVRKDVKEQTGGQQVPWVSMSMEREFCFVGGQSNVVAPVVTPAQPVAPVGTQPAVVAHKTGDTMSVDLGGGVKIEMVWIPPGEFTMGSPTNEFGRMDIETQHRVTLTRGFWMGKYEVTQQQWERVMGNNPSNFKGAKNPVERVSWSDCQELIGKLNASVGGGFRLPTEAEWEYACRAGTTTGLYNAKEISYSPGKWLGVDEIAWHDENSGKITHPVGQKTPNVWGLYDMAGNVWEWCQDWCREYQSNAVRDPVGPISGVYRVRRGGAWLRGLWGCRSADRGFSTPDCRWEYLGFRLARD